MRIDSALILVWSCMNRIDQSAVLEAARNELSCFGDPSELLNHPEPSGWKLGAAIYICDVDSSRTVMLETKPHALSQLSERAAITAATFERIRSATALLIGDLLNSTEGIHPDTRRGVIFGVALCITETRGFHITKHHGADVQYLLVRYRDASNGDFVLTPMPVFKAHPIAAAELTSTVTHILDSEQLNFPQRFGGVGVSFKERRRDVLAARSVKPAS